MNKFKFDFGLSKIGFQKIAYGFLFVIIIALLNSVLSSVNIQRNKKIISRLNDVIYPYVKSLEELNLLLTESKMYTTNWVYLPRNDEDKARLREIHESRYPGLKSNLFLLRDEFEAGSGNDSLEKVTGLFEELLKKQKTIMCDMVTFEDYENPLKIFSSDQLIEDEILPLSNTILAQLDLIIFKKREEAEQLKISMTKASNQIMTSVILFSFGLFILIVLASAFISKSIREPVLKMKEVIGKFVEST